MMNGLPNWHASRVIGSPDPLDMCHLPVGRLACQLTRWHILPIGRNIYTPK
jgi:hypothetical protein